LKLYTEEEIAKVREFGRPEDMSRVLLEFEKREAKMAPRQKVRRRRIPRKELDESEQVRFIQYLEDLWKKTSDPDDLENYLIFWFMHRLALSTGEVVGSHRNGSNLPGLQVGELQSDGIYVHRKKGGGQYHHLPRDIVQKMQIVIGGRRKTGDEIQDRIFLPEMKDPVGVVIKRMKIHAHQAGLEGWKLIQPTAYRRAGGTRIARRTNKNLSETKDLMGLQSPHSADKYVERVSPERQDEILLEDEAPESS
jgi:integrase